MKTISGEAARALFFGAYVLSLDNADKMPMWGKYIAGIFKFPIAGYTNQDQLPARRHWKTMVGGPTLSCLCPVCRRQPSQEGPGDALRDIM